MTPQSPQSKSTRWLIRIVVVLGLASLFSYVSRHWDDSSKPKDPPLTMTMDQVIRSNTKVEPKPTPAETPRSERVVVKVAVPSTSPEPQKDSDTKPKGVDQDQRKPKLIYADVITSAGTISMRLTPERAPKTVKNFIKLCEGINLEGFNKPFYNNLTFFRGEPDLFIQTGDPTNTGTGGLGFLDFKEYNANADDISPGTVAMAEIGDSTSKSQFYIALGDMRKFLGRKNTIFGIVVSGIDVAKKISSLKADFKGQPLQPATITEIKIRRVY